ncbi:exodeoxyribonuclease VII large subunit [Acinetobacter tianfuensis]|uniref:Exodeoxyribonuclease 7 large subunit n=1 Tax=Acinetobacter tianfuensis TaxID=2419603 RepID=A0A3A8EKH4_9GAMM|nr:exodeoxyribonuclease VII large subunit [Acinetobacter tianfuensis]RKG33996.1 exodeoxyribonuclease VII large subunit [Acinetobacter tianfuensis]
MSDVQLNLSEYLSAVKEVIQITFDDAVWVKAEIRNLNIKGGHYYLELAEKSPDCDKVIASCKATIWKFTAAKIVGAFEKESGIVLSRDLNVLIKIRARFDPQYGFSVNIEEIDSSFTLGDLAKRYQQIVLKLTEEGLIERNIRLAPPFDIQRVMVIAPENAAGLGDFRKDADALSNAKVCEFIYHYATFQGNTAAQSIRDALALGLRQWAANYDTAPDLIVIIRGGGAVNDLAYLNDYDLAALLCKRTVPIWVGIGHEKDRTILDEIAHRSFDTPSKVIAGIRNHIAERVQETGEYLQSIQLLSQQQISIYQNQNDQLMMLIQTLAQNQLQDAAKQLTQLIELTENHAGQQLKFAKHQIEALMREALLQNPRTVLSKGFAIVRQQSSSIHSVKQLQNSQPIQIELQDGILNAELTHIHPHTGHHHEQ